MGHEIGSVYLYLSTTFLWWLVIGMSTDGALAFLARLTGLEIPRRFFAVFAMLAIFFAGFMAWRDEHEKRLLATKPKAPESSRVGCALPGVLISGSGIVGPKHYPHAMTVGVGWTGTIEWVDPHGAKSDEAPTNFVITRICVSRPGRVKIGWRDGPGIVLSDSEPCTDFCPIGRRFPAGTHVWCACQGEGCFGQGGDGMETCDITGFAESAK